MFPRGLTVAVSCESSLYSQVRLLPSGSISAVRSPLASYSYFHVCSSGFVHAFQFAGGLIFVFGDLCFAFRRGPFDRFGVAVGFAFDRRRLALRRGHRFHVVRGVVCPFRFVFVRIDHARTIVRRVIAVRGRVPVPVGHARDVSTFVVREGFGGFA